MSEVATPVREVRIKLFGGFRQHREDPELAVEVAASTTVAALRSKVAQFFEEDAAAQDLLKVSAFATDRRVLDDDENLPMDTELSLLPPVCGG